MAVLFSIQSGNLTDATTWGVVDNTSYLNSTVSSTSTTTSAVGSSTFIPGAITISGFALQLAATNSSPSGTFTVQLFNNTTSSIITTITINVTDLPLTGGSAYIGWAYFKFSNNQTLVAGNSYSIRILSSLPGQVAVYRDSTANNWSRALITTTTSSPANTDTLLVGGEYTAAGVNNTYTITMNSTSNTNGYGLSLGAKCVFEYGASSNTNYKFRLSQSNLLIGRGATFKIGDSVTPIPSSSTAEFEFTCVSAGQFRIENYGTFITQGATVIHRALLASDISTGATTSTTNISTGWKNGDLIAFPSTTRTTTEFETEVLTSDASGTTLTHTSTTNAHGGNSISMVQADLANLTRNIKFFSTSTTNRGYIIFTTNSNATIFYSSFVDLGFSTSAAGIQAAAGTFNYQYNSYYQTVAVAFLSFSISSILTSRTISNNVFYNLGLSTLTGGPVISGNIDDNNVCIGLLGSRGIVGNIGSNNALSGNNNIMLEGVMVANSTGNNFYSNSSSWYTNVSITTSYTISNLKMWRNNNIALFFGGANANSTNRTNTITIDNLQMFGNVVNIDIPGSNGPVSSIRLLVKNSYLWGGSTLVSNFGVGQVSNNSAYLEQIIFQNTVFGKRPDNVDSFFGACCVSPRMGCFFTFYNCSFFGTEISYNNSVYTPYYIGNGWMSFNHNNVAGDHRQIQMKGLLRTDSTYSVTGKSIRLIPQLSSQKTYSSTYRVAVMSGNTCTVSVAIRRSSGSDGSPYNGNPPRLMYMFNLLSGNLTETVGASYTNNNLIIYAQNFENAYWGKNAMNVIANDTIGPTGLLDADKLIPTAVNSEHNVSPSISPVPALGNTETYSVYAKYGGYDFLGLRVNVSNIWSVSYFNLSTGVVSTSSPNFISSNISDVGNGWYRCSITFANRTLNVFQMMAAPTQSVSSTGNGVDGIYVWGAQLQVGTLTNYIPDGTWETLTYTTPSVSNNCVLEFYIDCDGTAGFINVDDFKTTTFVDTRNGTYLTPIGSYIEADWRRPGGSYGFIS
jgi:hypothetical protein